ncbi:MAG: activase [Geobacter sp.]|nr:activase [Geobacter sp.]
MRSLGIDIGSRNIKAVVVENGRLVDFVCTETTFDPLPRCRQLLASMGAARVMATGYGRHLLEVHGDIPTITEIKAFARGSREMFPDCRTVIDIGGQDTKVISLGPAGNVIKFEMNDRCAAGTGKFLEVMAEALGFTLEEFASLLPFEGEEVKLSSMCTVFAESEVVSLIAKGVARADIARGVQSAVASRVAGMAKRFSLDGEVVFAGGCANSRCLRQMLEHSLGCQVSVHSVPEITGAFGAALYAAEAA